MRTPGESSQGFEVPEPAPGNTEAAGLAHPKQNRIEDLGPRYNGYIGGHRYEPRTGDPKLRVFVPQKSDSVQRERLREEISRHQPRESLRGSKGRGPELAEKRLSAIESADSFEAFYDISDRLGGIDGHDLRSNIEYLRTLAGRISNLNSSTEFNSEFNRIFEATEGGPRGSDELLAARYKIHKFLEKEHDALPLRQKFRNIFRRDRGEHGDGYAE